MKAIILAAGYGTRLYPLTKDRPKMLLEVAGRPMIDHIVEKLDEVEELDEYYVVTNHRFADQITAWAKNAPTSRPVRVFDDGTTSNEDRLGAIADIRFVLGKAEVLDEHLVVAGDNLFRFSLRDFVDFHRGKGGGGAIALKDMQGSPLISQYSVVSLDEDQRVVSFEEKPPRPSSSLVAICLYIFPADNRSLIDRYLAEGHNPDAPGYYLEWLHTKRDIYGWVFEGIWFDIGDVDSYRKANELWEKLEGEP